MMLKIFRFVTSRMSRHLKKKKSLKQSQEWKWFDSIGKYGIKRMVDSDLIVKLNYYSDSPALVPPQRNQPKLPHLQCWRPLHQLPTCARQRCVIAFSRSKRSCWSCSKRSWKLSCCRRKRVFSSNRCVFFQQHRRTEALSIYIPVWWTNMMKKSF